MSEVTPQELVEEITLTFDDAQVVPMPIDPTLTIQGEAADAKATGDKIAGIIGNLRVNEKAPVSNAITLYASDIKMSNAEGANTITQEIASVSDRTAADIMYDTNNSVSIKAALDDIYDTLDEELSNDDIDDIFEEVFGGGS